MRRSGSGFITFDEMQDCVRRELKKGPKAISHKELMALWIRMDESGDNVVTKDEVHGTPPTPLVVREWRCLSAASMASNPTQDSSYLGIAQHRSRDQHPPRSLQAAGFFKLGKQPTIGTPRKSMTYVEPSGKLVSSISRVGMDRAIDCQSTEEMMKDLKLAGEVCASHHLCMQFMGLPAVQHSSRPHLFGSSPCADYDYAAWCASDASKRPRTDRICQEIHVLD